MPAPAKRVKATTYRRDSPEVVKLCFRLIAETDARSVGDSHPSCYSHYQSSVYAACDRCRRAGHYVRTFQSFDRRRVIERDSAVHGRR